MAHLDEVYHDRNQLVLLAAFLAREAGYPVGWGQDPDEPAWPVVFIELPTGQVSWHLPPQLWDMPAHWLGPSSAPWDGHTTAQKAERITAYLRGQVGL